MPVSFNAIPNNARVPLFYAEMDNSMANTAVTPMRRLLIGQVNDNSTAPEINQLTLINNESLAKSIGGTGSQFAQMYNQWLKCDPMGEIWALPLQNTTGSVATGSVKLTGTAAKSGLINLYIAGTPVRVTVTAGDNAEAIVGNLKTAILANVDLPVTAVSSADTLTITCKWTGESGNDISLILNQQGRNSGEATPDGLIVNITPMAGGTGNPDLTQAFSSLGDEAFEFICFPFSDSASLDAFKELMNDASGRWSYTKQLYGHGYAAKRGSIGELVGLTGARNDQHITISCFEKEVPQPFWVVAAAVTARSAAFLSNDPARPTQTGELIGIQPAPPSNRFLMSERQSLLMNGAATIVYSGSAMRIERSVTTYQKNAYGQADNSYLDSETLHTSSYVLNFLKTRITSKFGRHKLASDGTRFGAGQAIVTPNIIRAELIAAYQDLEYLGIVENSELFEQYLIVERDAADPTRINVLFPPDYVNQLRVFAVVNQFRLQYSQTATN